MGLSGVGLALISVSTFSRAQAAPIQLGYQKDLPTYLLMSGLWSGTLYFGGFLGPTLAGQRSQFFSGVQLLIGSKVQSLFCYETSTT